MWPLTNLRDWIAPFKGHLTLVLILATAAVCFGLGWRQHGLEDAKDQAETLTRAIAARRDQEIEARKQDAANEAAAQTLIATTGDRTRQAHQNATLPDRQQLLPPGVVRDLNAAATAP